MAPKEARAQRVKLNLIQDGAAHVRTVQQSCRTWEYDVKKVMATLNCNHQQAQTVIALAQIEDAKQPAGKAATR